jgi:hypothetical protein
MLLLDIGITVGPLLGYISQLKLIKKTRSLGSFSIDVCAILLISNILRLYFWFTAGYAFNLFIQSILLIIIQLMLLQECVKVQQLEKSMFDIERFWRWESFEQYGNSFFYCFSEVLSIFCCQHCCSYCLLSVFYFRLVWPDDRILEYVDRGYIGPTTTYIKLSNKISIRIEFHDDRHMVFGRLFQNIVLRDGASTATVYNVWGSPTHSGYLDHFANHSLLEEC